MADNTEVIRRTAHFLVHGRFKRSDRSRSDA